MSVKHICKDFQKYISLRSHLCHEVTNFTKKRNENRKGNRANEPEQEENWNVGVIIGDVVPVPNCCQAHKDHVKGLQEAEVLVEHEKQKNRYYEDEKDHRQCCGDKVRRENRGIRGICDLLSSSCAASVDRKQPQGKQHPQSWIDIVYFIAAPFEINAIHMIIYE